jgi:hypothetical protein
MFHARFLAGLLASLTVVTFTGCSGARAEAQGPSVYFDLALGEVTGDGEAKGSAAAAAPNADERPAMVHEKRAASEAKDPEPLSLEAQWEFKLAYDAGEVRVTSVIPRRFAQPMETPRRYGRFSIELWIGHELVDRVRFDFPLVHPETHNGPPRSGGSPISLSAGAHSEQTVLVPASPRATRAVLVDDTNGQELELEWPPDRPMGPKGSGD